MEAYPVEPLEDETALQTALLQSVESIHSFLAKEALCSHQDRWQGRSEELSGLEKEDLPRQAEVRRRSCAEEVFQQLHTSLERVRQAGLLERFLASDWCRASAWPVLVFLLDAVLGFRGGLRKAAIADLKAVLRIPSWSQEFASSDSLRTRQKQLTQECRYLLLSEGQQQQQQRQQQQQEEGSVRPATDEPSGDFEDDSLRSPLDGAWFRIEEDHRTMVEAKVKEGQQRFFETVRQSGARIVILGNAGSGKSSCINSAFHGNLARTGAGTSVTTHITHYEASDECPIHIYDTKGFEALGNNAEVIDQLKQLVRERQEASMHADIDDPAVVKERIHAVWWVVDVAGGGRFDPNLMNLVHDVFSRQDLPILIVLNKCDVQADYVREVKRSVTEHCSWAVGVVEVVASPQLGPIMHLCEQCGSDDIMINCKHKYYNCDACGGTRFSFRRSYGFDDLIQATAAHIPDMVVLSLLSAQKEWLQGLNRAARISICSFVLLAGALGASPLPFQSRFFLMPLQFAMVAHLAKIYDLLVSAKTISHIVMSLTGVTALASLGCFGANFLKTIPGLNFVGMASDATISAITTAAMGLLVNELFIRVRGKALAGEIQPEHLAEAMNLEEQKQKFSEYFNRLRAPFQEILSDMREGVLSFETERLGQVLANAQV